MEKNFVCIDIETTGIKRDSEIIEFAAARVRDGAIVDTFQELVKPQMPIPEEITRITGIREAEVEMARSIYEVLPDLLDFIGDDVLVGHNISGFDLDIIDFWAGIVLDKQITNDCIDTLNLSKEIQLKHHTLEVMCDYFGIENKTAHRALSDVIATIELYYHLSSGDRNPDYIEKHAEKSIKFNAKPNEQSLKIRELNTLIERILEKSVVEDTDVSVIKRWLDDNKTLQKSFPVNLIVKEIDSDVDRFHKVLLFASNPIKYPLDNSKNAVSSCIGKNIVITGQFETQSRNEIENMIEDIGVLQSNVNKHTNMLVVGEGGSEQYSVGNYGNKIKKALEMQLAGSPIAIISESDFMKIIESEDIGEQLEFDDLGNVQPIDTINEILKYAASITGYDLKYFSSISIKDGYSLQLDKQLFAKTDKNIITISTKSSLISKIDIPQNIKIEYIKNPTNFVKLTFNSSDEGIEFLKAVTLKFAEEYIPAERFGCCHLYEKCSDSTKCLAIDKFHAKGCFYRENLENGRIFYGKNQTLQESIVK